MHLEMFKYIDDIIDLYESKRDMFKLITEEIVSFFEDTVFSESRYTLSMASRLKSPDSIREKLLRNNYISKYRDVDTILENFQDLIGLRIECKFIDDEKYVYSLLPTIFTETDDRQYYYNSTYPRIKLKLSDPQPQKQKNGFDIYKIDGLYQLGKDQIRFELQIMALVNSFWGEIEHKIIYKNNTYLLSDNYVTDLMTSIKKSLSMIDNQLYVLYSQFRRAEQSDNHETSVESIERFISKMVYDVFSRLMKAQVGFTMDFRTSCNAVVRYLAAKNNAKDVEEYSRIMLNMFYILNGIEERGMRVDSQLTFGSVSRFPDQFSRILYDTVLEMVNSNYKWHIFFVMLFSLEWDDNNAVLEKFLHYYKKTLLENRSFIELQDLPESEEIREDLLTEVAEVIRSRQNVEFFSPEGVVSIHRGLNRVTEGIRQELTSGKTWGDIRRRHLAIVAMAIELA